MASRGAKGAGPAGSVIRASDMEKLGIEQLKSLKEQADLEVNLLQDSLAKIRTAATRLEATAVALHDLSLQPQGKKLLVPLTASLYVPGTLDDSEKVLVDVGTGYFVEKTMAEGKDYCNRKLSLLKSNHDGLTEVPLHRRHQIPLQLSDVHLCFDQRCAHQTAMATKKKTVADEAALVLQAKLRQASPST